MSSNDLVDHYESDDSNNTSSIISELSAFVAANSTNIANGRSSCPKSPDEEIIDFRKRSSFNTIHREKIAYHQVPFILATQRSPRKDSKVDLFYLLLSPTPKKNCTPIMIANDVKSVAKIRPALRRRLALTDPYTATSVHLKHLK